MQRLKALWFKYFNIDAAVNTMEQALVDNEEHGGEMLDEAYLDEEDDDDSGGKKGGAAGAEASGGAAKGIRDDLFSPITIDDYLKYRAKPVIAYLEKTSPWRGFWMQFIEIIIFILNASGAALVGMGTAFIPFVAMTVAGASIFRSFLEFSNLTKQVEGYNLALNMCHNLLNDWDRMTRTERRTSQTIRLMVGTVELAMDNVAAALTDALPGGQKEDDGNDKEEEK